MVRGAFLEALNIMKQKHGKTFSEIIADWMEKNPLAVLNVVSKFTVRETKNEHRGNPDQPFTVPLQSTQDLIERVIRETDNKEKPTPRSQ